MTDGNVDAAPIQPQLDWPPKFSLDQERVLNLFIGEGFYSSADASLREAILNALDAVGRRRETTTDLDTRIEVLFDTQDVTLQVSDNGDGMGVEEIARLFTTVGASASQLLGQTEAERYRSVGKFGIGVISYFLVCDEYEVQTLRNGLDPIGLRFSRAMLDGVTPAEAIPATRGEIGTTVRLSIKSTELLDLLITGYPKWVRDVPGLTARLDPAGTVLDQGGLSRDVRLVAAPTRDWLESAHLGPPTQFAVWEAFDGRARVDVLYRGVHVDRFEANRFWGIEGSIHVDPAYFRPKLNREGFVGGELRAEVEGLLAEFHPAALTAAIETLRRDLDDEATAAWSLSRWVSLWLAVPRDGAYREAALAWDGEFLARPTFRLLGPGDSERDVSVSELAALGADEIYVAPLKPTGPVAVIRQAIRALRARGKVVIRGIEREQGGFLHYAAWAAPTTTDLLLTQFRDRLPPLRQVETMAADLVRQDSVIDIYDDPRVRVVQLGADTVPLVAVGDEIWLNIDHEDGRRVIRELAVQNQGQLGLWIACLIHSPESTAELVRVVKNPSDTQLLGPVMRAHLNAMTDQ